MLKKLCLIFISVFVLNNHYADAKYIFGKNEGNLSPIFLHHCFKKFCLVNEQQDLSIKITSNSFSDYN